MKKTIVFAAGLLAAFACTAGAQDYDLKKLLDREPAVGAKLHEVETESQVQKQTVSQGGNVVQSTDDKLLSSSDRVVEILAVGENKKATKRKVTYSSLKMSKNGEEKVIAVEGLVITVDATGDEVVITAEGGKEIPDELKMSLEAEATKDKNAEDKGPKDLMPEGTVKMGGEWTMSGLEAAKALGLPEDGIDAEASSFKGTLSAGEGEGRLKVTLKIHVVYKTFQGMPCTKPMTMDLEATIDVTAEGEPYGAMSNAMTMDGEISANGAEIVLGMSQSSKKSISAAK